MMKTSLRLERDARGFSLVELITVVAILAIIVSIGVPSYIGYTRSAKREEARTNLLAIKLLLEQRYADAGTYCPPATNCASASYTYTENGSGTITAETIRTQGGGYLTNFKPKSATSATAVLYDYTLAFQANTLQFAITAAPVSGRGAPTGNLSINQDGAKTGSW